MGHTVGVFAVLFFGPNTEHSYLTRGTATEDLKRNLLFVGFDLACEVALFFALVFYVKVTQAIDVIAAGRTYFTHQNLCRPVLCAWTAMLLMNIGLTFDFHFGMDPTFQFS